MAARAKPSALKETAPIIAECIAEKLSREISVGDLDIVVRVEVDEDWPYTVTVETKASSQHSIEDLEKILDRFVEECVEEAANNLRKKGFEPLP